MSVTDICLSWGEPSDEASCDAEECHNNGKCRCYDAITTTLGKAPSIQAATTMALAA